MPDIDLSHRSNKKYLSTSKHQKNARNKYSKWETIDLELETFNNGDKGSTNGTIKISWLCQTHLWGFSKNNNGSIKTVGTEKQQFGFFETPRNTVDHWHGYPIIPFKSEEKKHDICKELLHKWRNDNELTADEIANLVKGKLL